MRQIALRLTFITSFFAGTAFSLAQDPPTSNPDQELESLYDQMDQQSDQASKKEEAEVPKTLDEKPKEPGPPPKVNLPEAKTITELNKLQPFSDIAVIERRYLPKTGRFEISAIGLTNLNNPFFNNFGGAGKLAYYLTEQYALELVGMGFAVAARQVTSDLQGPPVNITTSNVVTPRNFFGGAFKWNPIYGKISFLNNNIVPFDVNFSLGGGVTGTDQNREEPTVYLATSQVFALSKSWAFRWDIDWNFYNAHAYNTSNQAITLFHNDLFIGVGFSVYFPEATYR